ncbi:hypothetical protein LTR62_006095 [Meristemomyces frigidus]|uniref:Uncharacterized protein n=1 Tax=Meristemomyces frigidus TaxID=1508187 RepID=A0AAN7TD15_9PEZI|nr:hypothetical protein LTR62_006095 [Meristemomyces frigidus]
MQIQSSDGPKPKCYLTHANLPTYIDREQPPYQKLELIIRKSNLENLTSVLSQITGQLNYARVYMKLSDILSGDFFNTYIKKGNILLRSEGRPGIDHVYSLTEGVLRLEVDKPTYERAGLPGVGLPSQGRKHVKTRYAVEINLRLPSMVSGKPGFDRLVWASRNVLDRSVSWLVYNMNPEADFAGSLAVHQPTIRAVEPRISDRGSVMVPAMPESMEEHNEGAMELLEWLTIVASGSPRARADDTVDSYLCRYQHPESSGPATEVASIRWRGFIPSNFAGKVLLAALKTSEDGWFGMTATSFDGSAYSIFKQDGRTMTWEYMD